MNFPTPVGNQGIGCLALKQQSLNALAEIFIRENEGKLFMKATCKQLKDFSIEESKTSKLYAKLGFGKQARDEARHSKFFKTLCKKMVRK